MDETQICPHCSSEKHQPHADKDKGTLQCNGCGKFFNTDPKFRLDNDNLYEVIGFRNLSDVVVTITKDVGLTGTYTSMFVGVETVTKKYRVFVVGEKLLAELQGYDEETKGVKINFQCNRFSIPVDAAEFKEYDGRNF